MTGGLSKNVEDAPSQVEKQIDDFGAQRKAGSVAGNADEFEKIMFVLNDDKNWTVKYAQDKKLKALLIDFHR